jgi:hypothetical protein
MSLTFAETPRGTPAALRADSQGRLDESWDYTFVNDSGPVHTGPCVVAGFTPVALFAPIYLRLRDGTGPAGQILWEGEIGQSQDGHFFQPFPPGGARLQNGLYVQLDGDGSVLIWLRRG